MWRCSIGQNHTAALRPPPSAGAEPAAPVAARCAEFVIAKAGGRPYIWGMSHPVPDIADLPIAEVLPEILRQLRTHDSLVIEAPPGAGKTTGVPLCLLDEPWTVSDGAPGRIIILEPRRLAARAAARRMAALLGEAVGETVGYRVRLDSRVSRRTRIEVVTEGVLIRLLQQDAELSGVCAVIFDEFHERSLEADLALALCLDVQQGLRDDLKLIVMSATLDGEKVAEIMGNAPIVTSAGRAWPVAVRYQDRPVTGPVEQAVAEAALAALRQERGSLLAFLPGAGEIERCATLLRKADPGPEVIIAPLYGMMRAADQDRAIAPPPPGMRKIVLATDIAETSLTIDGIRIVIDGGLARQPRYNVASGMSRLETRALSRASAEQRAGRAGRLEAGICYRLWTAAAQRGLHPFAAPEITRADLAPLALELANWGIADPAALTWLDPPEAAAMSQARDLLRLLGALDGQERITDHGRRMARLAMHPRLAHMVLTAQDRDLGELAIRIAALLAERDILRERSADMRLRLMALGRFLDGGAKAADRMTADRAILQQIRRQLAKWRRALRLAENDPCPPDKTGLCLALAYPDRLAGRRPGGDGTRYLLSGGRGARLDPADELCREQYLTVCHLDRGAREARIFLAAPLTGDEIEDIFADQIRTVEEIEWDNRTARVRARAQRMLGRLPLKQARLKNPDPDRVMAALCEGIRKMGLASLPWDKASQSLRDRVLFCRRHDPAGDGPGFWPDSWPDFSDDGLLATVEQWLGPYLTGLVAANVGRDQLKGLKMADILRHQLDWRQGEMLDRLAPSHIRAPSGSNIAIDYSVDPPVLAVRLQEMFGLDKTPTVLGGRLPLLIHLLSPAQRPLQVTRDLENFWRSGYESVKKDMKGRYPRHFWPDDPLQAPPTRRAKPRK